MSKLGQIFTAGVSNDIAVLIDDVALASHRRTRSPSRSSGR